MRYYINFDKTVNQFVPHYIGGRKLILYLQSILSPLRWLNDQFVTWAKETRIEAAMTSQMFYFEWYLNHKFGKYLTGGQIYIKNYTTLGSPIYHQSANIADSENMLLTKDGESISATSQSGETEEVKSTVLYRSDEQTEDSSVSFVVISPAINTALISNDASEALTQYKTMLARTIDRYRLAGKTYIIKIES